MRPEQAPVVRLSDYRVPDYLIDRVQLDVALDRKATIVKSLLSVRPNPHGRAGAPLTLDGEDLVLVAATLDGAAIASEDAEVSATAFTLHRPPAGPFSLSFETRIDPAANTRLMGLYRSGSAYCTQCEAEGFRRITYFLDRPDVLSVYTVRIEADRDDAPVLLSNGNPVSSGAIENTGRHFAVWHDPHPKPCYLFALVGGDLSVVRDTFTTSSQRRVALGIYVEPGKTQLADYAMDALKRSMCWDEEVFGREYDLDVFNIVAVSDFTMGAMENKGLNIFNDKYVLASPATATDADYAGIETVIAHEYFHNWTGNRITCRDWFQLCLKEGLTVFRDHEFSSDMRSRAVRRIADVRTLRAQQFIEDAGPLAHNVRPTSYREINNFYTATVYEKGAELIRMLKVLIGDEAFAQGMNLYFERCDGTATTIEVFLQCFGITSGRDLTRFARWYHQSGTPDVDVTTRFNAEAGTLSVTFAQTCPPTPGQDHKEPFTIPIAFGLIGGNGQALAVHSEDLSPEEARGTIVLDEAERTIRFTGLGARPVLSLLRGFSAPVRLRQNDSDDDLVVLAANDSDPFNRWQSAQTLALRLMMASTQAIRASGSAVSGSRFAAVLVRVLDHAADDPPFAAQVLALPGEADVAREFMSDIHPDAIHDAREALRAELGTLLASNLLKIYESFANHDAYSPQSGPAGRRALRNAALDLFSAGSRSDAVALAKVQFDTTMNMTDRMSALGVLVREPGDTRDEALDAFYRLFETDALAIDKWFAIQAIQTDPDVLARIRRLMDHPAFSLTNPNRVRALIGTFATANPMRFNAADGSGFDFVADTVLQLDSINGQVAARLLSAFKSWRALESGRKAAARSALQRVQSARALSPDVADIVARCLA